MMAPISSTKSLFSPRKQPKQVQQLEQKIPQHQQGSTKKIMVIDEIPTPLRKIKKHVGLTPGTNYGHNIKIINESSLSPILKTGATSSSIELLDTYSSDHHDHDDEYDNDSDTRVYHNNRCNPTKLKSIVPSDLSVESILSAKSIQRNDIDNNSKNKAQRGVTRTRSVIGCSIDEFDDYNVVNTTTTMMTTTTTTASPLSKTPKDVRRSKSVRILSPNTSNSQHHHHHP
jgi:hypothetical protein